MRTIALLRPAPTATLDGIRAALLAEERAVWRAYVSGELRGIHYDLSLPGAVVLDLETDTAERARELVRNLPLVGNGLLDPKLIPTKPYDGLANLFGPGSGFSQTPPDEWR